METILLLGLHKQWNEQFQNLPCEKNMAHVNENTTILSKCVH